MIACKQDRWHCIAGGDNYFTRLVYQISTLLFLYNSRITIWRFCDELVTLLCQYRILRKYRNAIESQKVTPTQSL
uniref:Uncharacterized protein n=1 Tax=Acrobeloides nanus TaxID=290746 RepID=A0A914E3V4_9BILA